MELPDSYSNALQFVPKKARPMVEAGIKLQAERRNALASQLAQKQIEFQNERDEHLSDLQKEFDELPEETKQFPAIQHEVKRQKILADLNFERNLAGLKAYGQKSDVLNSQLKMVDEKYKQYEEDLLPIEKTQLYKTAKENWHNLNNLNTRVNGMISQIQKSKELLDNNDSDGALRVLKTFGVKQINSVPSDDAVGNMEVLFKYDPLMGVTDTAVFTNKGIMNPSIWFNKYREAKTQQEKEGVKKGLFETVNQMIEADPKAFLEIAINGSNAHIDSYNRQLKERVINPTSPGIANKMGAVPMEYISQIQRAGQVRQENPLDTKNPFATQNASGQTVSGGASATMPITGQSQQQNLLQKPLERSGSTLFRIKPTQ